MGDNQLRPECALSKERGYETDSESAVCAAIEQLCPSQLDDDDI